MDTHQRTSGRSELVVRLVLVVCLAIDAVVHFRLAPGFNVAAPGGVGGGTLFFLQAGAATLAGLALLVRPGRTTYVLAGLVALSGAVPVVLYSLVQVPQLGPIPSMYDPMWYPDKILSAVAEWLGVVLAVLGVALTRGRGSGRKGQQPVQR